MSLPPARLVPIFGNMTEDHPDLRSAFEAAAEAATATLGDVAEGIGRARRTLHMYLSGERRVTADAARELAQHLRERSEELAELARELERVTAEAEEADDG